MKCISTVMDLQFQINLPLIVLLCEELFYSVVFKSIFHEVWVLLHLLIHLNDDDRLT